MGVMRNRLELQQDCTGLVQKQLGGSWQVVKEVYDNLALLQSFAEEVDFEDLEEISAAIPTMESLLAALEEFQNGTFRIGATIEQNWINVAGSTEFTWNHNAEEVNVFLNGVLLTKDVDYTADGEKITFVSPIVSATDRIFANSLVEGTIGNFIEDFDFGTF